MQNSLIDYSPNDLQKGFRLHHLEVFNWGTFNENVWRMEPLGFSSLLTGNIGSGKSTLVDALLTLLVPSRKIVYNKAAGSESKERTLLSYVRGEYKSQRSEYGSNSSPVYLRDESDYTVLLARFYNKGYESGLTLAQVFWIRNEKAERFFVVSQQDLRIKEHFSIKEDDSDIFSLKKRIKSLERTEVFDGFGDYSSKFRSFFGISSEKVLELFYQTVSMKSVGRLTDFMRNHMLEKPDAERQIEEINRNFENLTKTYEAVQKAKRQLERLGPLVKDIDKYKAVNEESIRLRSCLAFLPFHFTRIKSDLLDKEIKLTNRELETVLRDLDKINRHITTQRGQEKEIEYLINQNQAGQRITQLKRDIAYAEQDQQARLQKEQEYASLCKSLGFLKVSDNQAFHQLRQQAEDLRLTTDNDILKLTEERDSVRDRCVEREKADQIEKAELESLSKRKTKILDKDLQIRNTILAQIGLEEAELPFVGELLQVKNSEREWEGAIERVLHSFGLSVLVAERHYSAISDYVDRTNLKGRLVYHRVPGIPINRGGISPEKQSLTNKVDIKADSEFYDWIDVELGERFNYTCCDSLAQFQRERKAITKNGQIKGSRGRHEKDDRWDIRDSRKYILGWNNQEKVNLIKKELEDLSIQIQALKSQRQSVETQKKSLEEKQIHIRDFLKFSDYDEINWEVDAKEIERLKLEVEELSKASDQLELLNKQLDEVKRDIISKESTKQTIVEKKGRLEAKIGDYNNQLIACEKDLAVDTFIEDQPGHISLIESHLSSVVYDINSIDKTQEDVRRGIETILENTLNKEKRDRDNVISKMEKYKHEYPDETTEIIATIEAIPEFIRIYEKVKTENLPKYEDKFKQQLKEGTINDIALFKNQLENNAKQIEKKIRAINESLRTIEYANGTYIELSSDKSQDIEIREFQIQLRDCLENTFGGEDYYTEEKFNQVKKMLDRFKNGEREDINWTNKVTDVRNWFTFSAVERYMHDGKEKEYYSDSSGKSGGQKEKLAYTILASALAYQFGQAENQPKSKTFRFVMIDEAFGRGSDESTRYGLDLFKKLNLQLLIITPLQKIHIIENYINCVHFVSNEDGDCSRVRDIPIEEYREEKLAQIS